MTMQSPSSSTNSDFDKKHKDVMKFVIESLLKSPLSKSVNQYMSFYDMLYVAGRAMQLPDQKDLHNDVRDALTNYITTERDL